MILVAHRRNTLEDLENTPPRYGVEVDVRSSGRHMIVHHDPFREGERFEDWVQGYDHGLLILNVKEEGLEDRLLKCMRERKIENFFFLDQSFPFLIRTTSRGESRCAVRVSEFESPDTALALSGKADWVWVDCFSRFPLDRAGWIRLREAGFRLCLVSPELVGRRSEEEILAMKAMFAGWGVEPDAVCAKQEVLPLWAED